MVTYLSDKLLQNLIDKQAIDGTRQDVKDYYRYGIEITVSSLLNITLIVLISLALNSFFEGIIFLLIFVPLRQLTGGFHASTYLKCNLIFSLSFTAVIILYRLTSALLTVPTAFCLSAVGLGVILLVCPVANENKPITEEKRIIRLKLYSSAVYTLIATASIILIAYNLHIGALSLYTLQLIILFLIIAVTAEGRKENEKAEQNS